MGFVATINGRTFGLTKDQSYYVKSNNQFSIVPLIDLSSYLKTQNVKAGTNISLVTTSTGVTISSSGGGSSGHFVSASTFNQFTGTTAPATYLNKTAFNSYSGVTLTNINSRLLSSGFNAYSGITNSRLSTIEGDYITGATNGLSLSGKNIGLNSAYGVSTLTGDTFLDGYVNMWLGTVVPLQTFQIEVSDSTGFTGSFTQIFQTPTNIELTMLVSGGSRQPGSIGINNTGVNILGGSGANPTQLFIGDENYQSHNTFFKDFRATPYGLEYSADYSATYSPRSFVDKGFVTGVTNSLLTKSAFNTYSGATLTNINSKVSAATNGLSLTGTKIKLGGALTGVTFISGTSVNTLIFSGATASFQGIKYAKNFSANYVARSLVDKSYITGLTGTLLVTTAFNTYSGNTATLLNLKAQTANNGIQKSGTNLRLGGQLTGSTQIGLTANNLTFTASTGTLKYGGNYSANFVARSIVDKGYVTGVTVTCMPKTYSGSTGFITLTGGTAVVSTNKVSATSKISLTVNGGTQTNVGFPYISARSAGISFTVKSSNSSDTSQVAWFIYA